MYFSNFVFTVNNYTDDDIKLIDDAKDKYKYIVYGKEVGESGTPHLQGYCELKRQQRNSYIHKFIPRGFFAKRLGTAAQAIKYCKKDGDFTEHGTPNKQGKRTDIEAIKERIKKGESYITIAWDCANYNIMKMAKELCSLRPLSHEYNEKTVFWLWGETGSGKTRTAMEACPADDTWHATTGMWFDGYFGQGYAIIDEMRAKDWPYALMLRLLDGYQLRIPIKGGFTVWNPHTVYITCPLPPEKIYAGQLQYQGSIDQLLRRLTEVKHLRAPPKVFPVFNKSGLPKGATLIDLDTQSQ